MAVLSRPGPMAVLSRPLPFLSRGLQVLYYLAQSVCHQKRAQWPFCQGQVQWPKYKAFAVLSRQKQPSGQTSRFEPRIASSIVSRAISLSAAGPSHFIKAMSNGRFIKAFAVLSKQKQPSGQTSRFEPRIANSILARAISLSASGPSHQKRAQWPFYQGQVQWPFYQGRSS